MDERLAALVSTVFFSGEGFASLVDAPFHGEQRDPPPIYDLRWSADGKRLTACLGEIATLQRSDAEAPIALAHENAAGRVRLAGPPGWKGVPRRPREPWALSVDHRADGRALSVWSDGTVRSGLERDARVIVTLQNAQRVRASRVSRLFAVRAGRDLFVCDDVLLGDGAEPRRVATNVEEHSITWAPDRDELALVEATPRPDHFRDYALVVVDADGRERRRLALGTGDPPTLAWAAGRLVVHRAGGLLVVEEHGTREIPRASPGYPAAITTTPDGRFAALAVLSLDQTRLEIADLDGGAIVTVPWAVRLTSGLPFAFSPQGDALAWIDSTAVLQLVRWGEVYEDPDRRTLERAEAHAREGRADEAIDLLRSETLRPPLAMRATALLRSLEATRDARRRADASRAMKPRESAPFAVGDRVRHAKLGAGTVRAVEGTGDTAKITVDLEGGPRVLRASFLVRADDPA